MWLYLLAQLPVPLGVYVFAVADLASSDSDRLGVFLTRSWAYPLGLVWYALASRRLPQRWLPGCLVSSLAVALGLYLGAKSFPAPFAEACYRLAIANGIGSPLLGYLAARMARRAIRRNPIESGFELVFRLRARGKWDGRRGRLRVGPKFLRASIKRVRTLSNPRPHRFNGTLKAPLSDVRYMYEHHTDGRVMRAGIFNFDAAPGPALVIRISRPRAITDEYWDLPLDDPAHVAETIRQRQRLAEAEAL